MNEAASMSADPRRSLSSAVLPWGVSLATSQLDQFDHFEARLSEWNERMNLTAVTGRDAIWRRHFLDSLSICAVAGDLSGLRLVDVGAGAGLPGLALKIAFPTLALTLVESVTKKARFVDLIVAELGLTAVAVVAERAEVVGRQAAHRERYDWAVARAVADLRVLAEYLLPLTRVGGHALAMKGDAIEAEVDGARAAIETLGGGPPEVTAVSIPGESARRHLVRIPKRSPTPAAYPRRPGRPGKRPL